MWKHGSENSDAARRGVTESQEGTELLAAHESSEDPEGGTQHVLRYVLSLTHWKSKGPEDRRLFFSWNVSHWGPDIIEGLVILYKINITNTAHLFYFFSCTSAGTSVHLLCFTPEYIHGVWNRLSRWEKLAPITANSNITDRSAVIWKQLL